LYFMREFMCLQCQGHVVQLARMTDQFKAADTQVLVIGGGNPRGAERLTQMLKPPFPVLIDGDRSVYHKYDLDKVLFIQRSGTFLIDKDGVVRYIHQVTNPGSSLNKKELLAEIGKLSQP
jgi:peroxiredoxin